MRVGCCIRFSEKTTSREQCETLNINAFQIFTRSSYKRQFHSPMTEKQIYEINQFVLGNDIKLFIHSPFYINFAKDPYLPKNTWVRLVLEDDLICAEKLGAIGCIIHMGKYKTKNYTYTESDGMKNMIQSINSMFLSLERKKQPYGRLILETASGQGSEICIKIEELAALYNNINVKFQSKVRFCVDTCHIFAAGYDIKTNPLNYFKQFDKHIGVDKIDVIHFNDSKEELNSCKDRHQSIGDGKIGLKPLLAIAQFAKEHKIPLILETPGDIQNQLKILKTL